MRRSCGIFSANDQTAKGDTWVDFCPRPVNAMTKDAKSSKAAARPRIVVGITGASGSILGVRMLETLRELDIESHLVLTRSGRLTLHYETGMKPADVFKLADVVHPIDDVAACISSGSYRTLGMIVVPCSMKSLAEIASGVTDNLLSRAADVVLKERRRLVLVVREAPLHLGHLRNMTAVTEMGAIVAPPVPAFYNKPETINDILDHVTGRVLDLFGLDTGHVRRWKEPQPD
jgi:4-hydroxy-3-polyprenylbenzoate decarboxylase